MNGRFVKPTMREYAHKPRSGKKPNTTICKPKKAARRRHSQSPPLP